jgi:hypothetical protein
VLCAGFLAPSCRDQTSAPIDRNQPPETILVGVPGDSSTTFYRVRVYWNGIDPDGEVVAYEWAITDSLPGPDIVYHRTARTDTVLVFPVEENREILGHRLYVRAIDNEGKVDPTPAFTFFAVRNNCAPVAWFTRSQMVSSEGDIRPITSTDLRAPTDTVPAGWSVEFAWTGSDCDKEITPEGDTTQVGQVVSYTYHLTPFELSYVGGEASDTMAAYAADRLTNSTYVMYVRARDDAGLSGLDPVLRTFVWNKDPVTYFYNPDAAPGSPDTSGVIFISTTGQDGEYSPHAAGDTLPLTIGGVTVRAYVRAYDPDPPFQIVAYNARLVRDSGFWIDITERRLYDWSNDPLRPHYTGNYYMMARAQDKWGRWDGTPDTLTFYVNFGPRWVGQWQTNDQVNYRQRPMPGGEYRAPNADTLRVYFAATDPDGSDVSGYRGVELQYRFDKFPLPGGGSGSESFFYRMPKLGVKSGDKYYWDQPDTLWSNGRFIPGDYTMTVQVKEAYSTDELRQRYGTRINEKTINFKLKP